MGMFQLITGRKSTGRISVLDKALVLVPTLEFLLKTRGRYEVKEVRDQALRFIEEFDDRLPAGGRTVVVLGSESRGGIIQGRGYKGKENAFRPSYFNGSIDTRVEDSVFRDISGSILGNSVRPTISGSVLIGQDVMNGYYDAFYRQPPKDMPYLASSISAFRSFNQYKSSVKMEESFLSGNPEHILRALVEYSKTVNHEQHGEMATYLKYQDKEIVPLILDNLLKVVPKDRRDALGIDVHDEKLIVAATLLYIQISEVHGDTYQVSVDNSVVFAEKAFGYVKGGSIRNSIVAAGELLTKANVKVENSYLITPNGARVVKNEVFGRPEIFNKVPPHLTDRSKLFEKIAPYRKPAIVLFKTMRNIRHDSSQTT